MQGASGLSRLWFCDPSVRGAPHPALRVTCCTFSVPLGPHLTALACPATAGTWLPCLRCATLVSTISSPMPQSGLQPPPEDAGELRLALNRMQRQNLKLSSKLARAQQEAQERWAQLPTG